ncbi:MAG TPA: tripartite tricarboxylate transporter TctB family protein [Thermodesulfobacteriota bacterium]|nr:tripartite tricarboxylate transporter TctB family protein [Thermodesulfobacteriota bacterium]
MNLPLRSNKDFWAGLMFLVFGGVAAFVARDYPFGKLLRMGSGFFPTLLGCILMVFGIYIMLKGLRVKEKIAGRWSLRALVLLPLMLVLFGALMKYAGFIPALAALVMGSAAAGREFRWGEVLLFTAFMTALSVFIFIFGLVLPYPLIKGF